MGVRLNKVLTELNIGLQTAIDFLKNKKELGEIRDDANVNTKITDEQYQALVDKFKEDKAVKTQAGMTFPKKEKKPKKEVKPEPVAEVREEPRQTFTPLGKIDLGSIGKPAKPQETKTPKAEPVEEKKAKQPEAFVEKKVEEPKAEPVKEVRPEVKAEPVTKPEPVEVPAQDDDAEEINVFKLKTEQKAVPNLNVVGKIFTSSFAYG